jgi:hypothetical protein
MTDVLDPNHVGRTEDIGQTNHYKEFQAFRHTLAKGNAFGPILFSYSVQIFTDLLNGIGPGYPFPFSFSPFPDPLQWVFEAIRMGEPVWGGQAFGTDIALV